jgi:hypothetical protein
MIQLFFIAMVFAGVITVVYFEINYLLLKRSPQWPTLEGGMVGLAMLAVLASVYMTGDMSGEAAILANFIFTVLAVLLFVPPVLVGITYHTRKCSAFTRRVPKDERRKIKLSRILRMAGWGGGLVIFVYGVIWCFVPGMSGNAADLVANIAFAVIGALLMTFSTRSWVKEVRGKRMEG